MKTPRPWASSRLGAALLRLLAGGVLLAGTAAALLLIGPGGGPQAPGAPEASRAGGTTGGPDGQEEAPSPHREPAASGHVSAVERLDGGSSRPSHSQPDLASSPGTDAVGNEADGGRSTDQLARRLREGPETEAETVLTICGEILASEDLNLDHLEIVCGRLGRMSGEASAELLRSVWRDHGAEGQAPDWEEPILGALIQPWREHGEVLVEIFPTLTEERKGWCLRQVSERRPETLRKWVMRLHRRSEDPASQYGGHLQEAQEAYIAHPPPEGPRR